MYSRIPRTLAIRVQAIEVKLYWEKNTQEGEDFMGVYSTLQSMFLSSSRLGADLPPVLFQNQFYVHQQTLIAIVLCSHLNKWLFIIIGSAVNI